MAISATRHDTYSKLLSLNRKGVGKSDAQASKGQKPYKSHEGKAGGIDYRYLFPDTPIQHNGSFHLVALITEQDEQTSNS